MKYTENELENLKFMIDNFLFKIYECLEESYGAFGEMGIDFGLDNKGKIWFIESNSKPAKTTIHMLSNDRVLMQSYLNPMEYAKHLSSFN